MGARWKINELSKNDLQTGVHLWHFPLFSGSFPYCSHRHPNSLSPWERKLIWEAIRFSPNQLALFPFQFLTLRRGVRERERGGNTVPLQPRLHSIQLSHYQSPLALSIAINFFHLLPIPLSNVHLLLLPSQEWPRPHVFIEKSIKRSASRLTFSRSVEMAGLRIVCGHISMVLLVIFQLQVRPRPPLNRSCPPIPESKSNESIMTHASSVVRFPSYTHSSRFSQMTSVQINIPKYWNYYYFYKVGECKIM